MKDRRDKGRQKRLTSRDPSRTVIDASKFSSQVADLAMTLINLLERDAQRKFPKLSFPSDIAAILRQIRGTYNLIRFINADDTRDDNPDYRYPYSLVSLPLIRTMIDGFYNITALLESPARARTFRIDGFFRLRAALAADELHYGNEPGWKHYLEERKEQLELSIRRNELTDPELSDKANRWPLLGAYLKQRLWTRNQDLLSRFLLGKWREYSSISHACYSGLYDLFSFISDDQVPSEKRDQLNEAVDLNVAMHYGRAAGVLLCALSEIQHFFKFDSADIDQRLRDLWEAMVPVYELREFYDYRYNSLLRVRKV